MLKRGMIFIAFGIGASAWLWIQPMGACASSTQVGLLLIALGAPIGAVLLLIEAFRRLTKRSRGSVQT